MNLSKSNYSIVKNIHQSLFEIFPNPDMLIFLDSGIEHVTKNIKTRNRDFEKELGTEYLENLILNYNFWLDKLKVPIVKIDAQSIHYDNEELLLKNLSSLLKTALL